MAGWKRPPGEGSGDLLQYSCLEKPMDREAWQATVHRVTKSWTTQPLNHHCLTDFSINGYKEDNNKIHGKEKSYDSIAIT